MERFAFRLSEAVDGLVKRVDLDTYGTFRSIILPEGNELVGCLSDAAPDEQPEIQDLAQKFFDVSGCIASINGRCSRITNLRMKRLIQFLVRLFTYRLIFPALMYIP
jgi:hypothetical protein